MTFEQTPYGGVGASHVDTCRKNVVDTGKSRAPEVYLKRNTQGQHTRSEVRELRTEGMRSESHGR